MPEGGTPLNMAEEGKSRTELGVALALFAALAALGAYAGGAAVKDFARARASVKWPSVQGVVLSKSAADAAEIRYAYVAGGRGHESRRVRFLSGVFASAPTAHLRPGESVTVYVDPKDPETAVLRPGGSGALFAVAALTAGGLVFIGLGGVIRTLLILWPAGSRLAEAPGAENPPTE